MKAIVILFNGEFISPAHQADLIGSIGTLINKTTTTEGADSLKVAILSETEIMRDIALRVKGSSETEAAKEIRLLCQDIIRYIGYPSTYDSEDQFKIALLRCIALEHLIENHVNAVKMILTEKLPKECIEVLKGYAMAKIVSYFKEIHRFTKLM